MRNRQVRVDALRKERSVQSSGIRPAFRDFHPLDLYLLVSAFSIDKSSQQWYNYLRVQVQTVVEKNETIFVLLAIFV